MLYYEGTSKKAVSTPSMIRDALRMALRSHSYIKMGTMAAFAGSKHQNQTSANLQQREVMVRKQERAGASEDQQSSLGNGLQGWKPSCGKKPLLISMPTLLE